jgi:hypothetical protein
LLADLLRPRRNRSARQITAELSAEYGPIPEGIVTEYLQALKQIGIVE